MKRMDCQTSDPRVNELFNKYIVGIQVQTDRVFAWLFVVQWVFVLITSIAISPIAWSGRERSVHIHVYAALFLGAAIVSLPLLMIRFLPGNKLTRYVVAAAQVLFSSLIIHLMGGATGSPFSRIWFTRNPVVLSRSKGIHPGGGLGLRRPSSSWNCSFAAAAKSLAP